MVSKNTATLNKGTDKLNDAGFVILGSENVVAGNTASGNAGDGRPKVLALAALYMTAAPIHYRRAFAGIDVREEILVRPALVMIHVEVQRRSLGEHIADRPVIHAACCSRTSADPAPALASPWGPA
jgi:hypothetical protein